MNLITFQQGIAVTGTAQNLPANPILRSITVAAPQTNGSPIVLGNAPDVTTATGYVLEKGQSVRIDLPGGNTASLWAVGTAGDSYSAVGS